MAKSKVSKLFDTRLLQSRVRSKNTTKKEIWLGYLLGPCGALLLNAVLGSYLNQYYVDVLGMNALFGGLFISLFPIFSKILDGVVDILYGYIIDHTKTREGKARPWILLSAPLLVITGILLFTVPQASPTIQCIYVVVTYNLFFSFAFSIYNMAHGMMVPLSTRNTNQRGKLSVMNQVATIMMSGILVALIFPMVIMPAIKVDKGSWILVMAILSTLCLPLTLVEYFYTKERITSEKEGQEEEKIPFTLQLKACFTDPYLLLLMAYFFVYTFGTQFKNLGLVYYSNYVLGTYSDGITQTLISVLGGIPMGIGIFAVWPLVRRFGKRNVTVIGFLIYAIGSAICWMAPKNMAIVLVGQFIKNIGGLPSAYVFMALLADCEDNLEWKTGFRSDGAIMALYNIITTTVAGVGTGLFNLFLNFEGYKAPVTVAANEVLPEYYLGLQIDPIVNSDQTISFIYNQNEGVQNFIVFAFVGLEVITGLLCAAMLFFVNVEKTIHRKQAVLVEREKEKFAKEGKAWLPADVRNEIEMKEEDRIAEKNYIEETRARCEKEGKDFAAVYAAHCYRLEEKNRKNKEAEEKNLLKEKKSKEKAERKLAEKLAKMNEDEKKAYWEKEEKKKAKVDSLWNKEKVQGEATYIKYQKQLEERRV